MNRTEYLFVGTYTEDILFGTGDILPGKGGGIHILALDADGDIRECGLVSGVRNPSFLCLSPDRRFLYAVNELKEFEGRPSGAVSAFAFTRDNDRIGLRLLNSRATRGTDPCHVAVNSGATHVYVSNFMSGSVTVFPVLSDGSLGPDSDFIQYAGSSAHPRRQTSPHAHSLVFDRAEKRAFVPDLGTDKLMTYKNDFERGRLIPESTPFFQCEPGDGPRFLEFDAAGKRAYLINEISSRLSVLDYDAATGVFSRRQNIATIPGDFDGGNICADLHLSRDGRFLYASNRGHDSLASYRVDPVDGTLTLLGFFPCGGKTPRNFSISLSGKFLLVANQDTDNLLSYRIDQTDGSLSPVCEVRVPTPVCVRPALF